MTQADHYLYTTAEISKYYSLTGKGLSFYEKKGIISPSRMDNRKYRSFSLTDCYHLYASKFYTNCGFSLAETADLIQCKDVSAIQEDLENKALQLAQQLQYQQLLLSHMNRITHMFEHLPTLCNTFSVLQSPSFYRQFVRRYYTQHESSVKDAQEFALWNSHIPINVASLEYDLDELEAGAQQFNINIGNIITEEDFHRLNYQPSNRISHLPSRRCVYTIIQGNDEQIYTLDRLKPCLAYIAKNNYRLCANPFTSMLVVANTPEGPIRFDEAWFPIVEA